MNVGIHKFSSTKIFDFEKIYQQILDYNNIENSLIHISEPDFWTRIEKLDLFISRWIDISDHEQMGHTLLPIINQEMGIKCLPDYRTFWPYDDKIKEYYLLKQHGFPVIDTHVFWDKPSALLWLETTSLPTVFKLRGGASSSNVVLVKSKSHGKKLINKMFGTGVKSGKLPGSGQVRFKDFSIRKTVQHWGGNILKTFGGEDTNQRWQLHKNYALFQKFLPGNTFDVRVVVIGERVFAFRRFNRENDFRASGSGKTDLNHEAIDIRCVQTALDVSQRFKFQTMGYDFLYDKSDNPLISEMSYTYSTKTLPRCPGYWDKDLKFHEGNYWPQFLQLVDALQLPDLKQPTIVLDKPSTRQKFNEYVNIG